MKKSIIFFLTIFLFSCHETIENKTTNGPSKTKELKTNTEKIPEGETEIDQDTSSYSITEKEQLPGKNLVYSWVDKLNIRNQASIKGKVLTSVNSADALELTKAKSEKMQTIVLRGVAYQDYWYQVRTLDGQAGWVFGGAVKQKNEQKGNAVLTKEKFDFPYFGAFDLSEWKKLKDEDVGSEEVDGTLTTYQKGGKRLEIEQWSMGEMGFGYRHVLVDTDASNPILKERSISFSPGFDQANTITELVKDFTQNPPVQYSRVQEINVSLYDLKPFPLMVLGTWKEEMVPEEENN